MDNKCKICNKEFKNVSKHIIYHNISSKDYYDKYLKKENEDICQECGKKTNFIKSSKGYRKFCSIKCSRNSNETKEKYKETCLEKYGYENVSQNKEIKEKKKITCLNNYSVDNPLKNNEIKNKQKQTNLEKYGVENPSQNKKIREKQKQTCLDKCGVEYPIQSEEIKNKIKQTNLEKYGFEYSSKNKEIRKKIESIFIEKYGFKTPLQSKEIKDKIKQINLNKQLPRVIKILEYNNLELLSDYNNSRESLKLKCLNCNNIFENNYFNIYQRDNSRCPICFPIYKSSGEIELLEFIKSIEHSEIIENDRNIINPHELDIYIPEKQIAIEFDGLYWHSERNIEDKYYHLNKTEFCQSKNIQLIHIFEDEWILKQDIVKSRLKQILVLNNYISKIHARKCQIREIDSKLKNKFLNEYHLQGEDKSNIKLGSFYQDELISVMTFSHGSISRKKYNDDNIWELSRFCSNSNYHIPGIAGKLLSYFKRNYEWKSIISYADRRWSQGNLYYKLGFELEHITKPNYWYIKNLNRIHRFNLRKKYSEPKDIPEWVLRSKEGYYRIWDCGHYKFIKKE